ncbi:MAG: MlaD family protein [Candidatus Binatia bacterium]
MAIGQSDTPRREFIGHETPPVFTRDQPGRLFVLETPDLDSLDVGTPVHLRRLHVGQIVSYDLQPDGRTLHVTVFVEAPLRSVRQTEHPLLGGERRRPDSDSRRLERGDANPAVDPARRQRLRDAAAGACRAAGRRSHALSAVR